MRPHRFLVPVLVYVGLVAAAVGSLGAPLVPTVADVYGVSLTSAQWSLTITLLAGALVVPVMGRLGDGPARRRVMLVGVSVVIAGCVLSALPLGFGGLLVGRGLQGIGLGLVPLAIATARDALPAARSGPVIGLLAVTTAAGVGVGYPLAGLVTERFGVSAAFWAGAIFGGAALTAACLVLPPGPDRAGRRLDVAGAVLLGAGLTGLLLALSLGADWGWWSERFLLLVGGSALFLGGWTLWELRTPWPLVEVRLLRHRPVAAADAAILLVGVGIYPLISLVSRLVQTPASTGYGFGSSVVVAGLMLVPFSVTSLLGSKLAVPLLRRYPPERVTSGGCAILVLALAVFVFAHRGFPGVILTMGLAGLGIGCVFASNPRQIVSALPSDETGSAMGFNQVARSVGFAAGSAVSAAILAAHTPPRAFYPTDSGYAQAALVGIAVLIFTVVLNEAAAYRSSPLRRATLASESDSGPVV